MKPEAKAAESPATQAPNTNTRPEDCVIKFEKLTFKPLVSQGFIGVAQSKSGKARNRGNLVGIRVLLLQLFLAFNFRFWCHFSLLTLFSDPWTWSIFSIEFENPIRKAAKYESTELGDLAEWESWPKNQNFSNLNSIDCSNFRQAHYWFLLPAIFEKFKTVHTDSVHYLKFTASFQDLLIFELDSVR